MFCYNSLYHAEEIRHRRRYLPENAKAMVDTLYLLAVILYVLYASFATTLFQISWPPNYLVFVRILACITILVKVGCAQAYSKKRWFVCVLSFIAFKLSWLSTGYDFLLDTVLLAIGAIDVPYKKILKAGFWAGLYVLLLAMMGSFAGCIKDLVYLDGEVVKHSFGIVYPTDFAAQVVYLFLTGWLLYGRTAHILPAAYAAVLGGFVYCYSGSRTSTIVLLLASVCILYISLTKRYGWRLPAAERLSKRIDNTLVYALPACAAIMVALTLFYATGNEMAAQLNWLLSNRMSLALDALKKHGITLFGTSFIQRGFGSTTAWTWALEYTFVDSSYMLILLRYGLTVLLALCIQSVLLNREALRHGHREVVLAAALIAVHSIMEHHLPEAEYNIFLLLPFANFAYKEKKEPEAFPASRRYHVICAVGLGIGITAAVALLLPRFVTYMKTIVDILNLTEVQNHATFIFIMSVCLLWASLLIWLVLKIILAIAGKNSLHRATFICATVLLTVFCWFLIKGEQIIRHGKSDYQQMLEADAPIMKTLLAAEGDGRLYVDHMPELYKREFSSVSDKILSSENLAMRENTTLITEDNEELWVLMAAGYKYGKLLSGHAVYTNDAEAITLLEACGIRVTPYYSREKTVNLWDTAVWNGLSMTEEGVLLSGPQQSILHGPWVTIYKGNLQVRYRIRIIRNTAAADIVATAKITSDGGLLIWKQQDIYAADFDEHGEYTCLLECYLGFNTPNVEFMLSASDNVELEVQEIRYGKVK